MPRFVKVTHVDGNSLWVNMALVISIGTREEALGGGVTVIGYADGSELRVKESPEHLVTPFR